jgi:hypothetical protein
MISIPPLLNITIALFNPLPIRYLLRLEIAPLVFGQAIVLFAQLFWWYYTELQVVCDGFQDNKAGSFSDDRVLLASLLDLCFVLLVEWL